MAYAKFDALLTRIHEVLTDAAGDLRTIPNTRFTDDLAEGFAEEEYQRRGVLDAAPFRVRIVEVTPNRASPPIGGNLILYTLRLEVTVSRTLDPIALVGSDELRVIESAAWADADVIRQALESGPNLRTTAAGAVTDIASSRLRHIRSRGRALGSREAGAAQRYETAHTFQCIAKSRPA